MIDTSSVDLINLLHDWDKISNELGSKVKRPESIKVCILSTKTKIFN